MRHVRLIALCLVVGIWLGVPSAAHACSCAGPLPSSAASGADIVFAGTVISFERPAALTRVNPDGSVAVSSADGPSSATFDVRRVYRGAAARQVAIYLGRTCDPPFAIGQQWLVYAWKREGRMETSVCSRTRLSEEAAMDIEYFEGVAQGRPQGLVHGAAHQRIVDSNGQPQLRVLFESVQVVGATGGRRFVTRTDSKSSYQLVLPPGDFEIWVERAGQRVSGVEKVRVTADMNHDLMVAASF